jgi:hypothetical protein
MSAFIGGANGSTGGRLSGASRNRAIAQSALPVRAVRAAPPARGARARPTDQTDPCAYELLSRAIVDKENVAAENAQLRAENQAMARQLAALATSQGLPLSTATMPSSSDRPATAPAPAARVRGCTPEDRERLESVKRGEMVLLQPLAKYGKWSLSVLYPLGQ